MLMQSQNFVSQNSLVPFAKKKKQKHFLNTCYLQKKKKKFSKHASDPGLADGRNWRDEKDRVPSLTVLPVA